MKIFKIILIVNFIVTILIGLFGFWGEEYFKGKIGTYPEMTKQLIKYKNLCGQLKNISIILLYIALALLVLWVISIIVIRFKKN